jgi:hypothetical protein
VFYFAYGSNLSTRRLLARVPSAAVLTTGLLPEHLLRFHKIGRDGSAKCNAFYTGHAQDRVLGVLFRIDQAHLRLLDIAEGRGRGYEVKEVLIISPAREHIPAFTYFATRIDRRRRPFRWYKEHVLQGLREHGFTGEYLGEVERVVADDDPDEQRTACEMDIYPSPKCSAASRR